MMQIGFCTFGSLMLDVKIGELVVAGMWLSTPSLGVCYDMLQAAHTNDNDSDWMMLRLAGHAEQCIARSFY